MRKRFKHKCLFFNLIKTKTIIVYAITMVFVGRLIDSPPPIQSTPTAALTDVLFHFQPCNKIFSV